MARNRTPAKKQERKPDKSWKLNVQGGVIEVSLWSREAEGDHGNYVQYSLEVHRSYYDEKEETWKSCSYYRPEHVPIVTLLLTEAWKYVLRLKNKKSPEENGAIPEGEEVPF